MPASSAVLSPGQVPFGSARIGWHANRHYDSTSRLRVRLSLRDATVEAFQILDDAMDADDAAQTALLAILEETHRRKDRHLIAERKLSLTVLSCCLELQDEKLSEDRRGVLDFYRVTEDSLSSIQQKELVTAVREAINHLTDKQREAITAHYYDEKTIREIAASMEISQHAANKLLMRARYRLKKALFSLFKDVRRADAGQRD